MNRNAFEVVRVYLTYLSAGDHLRGRAELESDLWLLVDVEGEGAVLLQDEQPALPVLAKQPLWKMSEIKYVPVLRNI